MKSFKRVFFVIALAAMVICLVSLPASATDPNGTGIGIQSGSTYTDPVSGKAGSYKYSGFFKLYFDDRKAEASFSVNYAGGAVPQHLVARIDGAVLDSQGNSLASLQASKTVDSTEYVDISATDDFHGEDALSSAYCNFMINGSTVDKAEYPPAT